MGLLDFLGKETTTNAISNIGGASTIASGILGSVFGGGGKGMTEQLNIQGKAQKLWAEKMARNLPRHQVTGAKKAGLHPLAVLGMTPAQGPQLSSFQNDMPGQDLGRAMASGISGYQEAKMANLQIKEQELRNQKLQLEVNNMTGSPPKVVTEPDYKTQANPKLPHITAGDDHPLYEDKRINKYGPSVPMVKEGAGPMYEQGPQLWYEGIKSLPKSFHSDLTSKQQELLIKALRKTGKKKLADRLEKAWKGGY